MGGPDILQNAGICIELYRACRLFGCYEMNIDTFPSRPQNDY